MPDRQTEKLPFRVIEVMYVNQIKSGLLLPSWDRQLVRPAGQGNAGIGRLDGCVDLYQVHAALPAPTGCLSISLRVKITLCRANTGRLAS
jgi:hypothetical protein